jgi:hypothetical protein
MPGLDAVQKARFTSRLAEIQEWLDREQGTRRPQTSANKKP